MNETKTILVVDDEERIRRLIRMYLERDEFIVEEAENGEIALEMALKKDYDVILLDVMMPVMDGLEMCEYLREEKNTPVIMLTAKGEESNRVQGFEVGVDDYIVKPFSPREVVLRVKAVLRRTHNLNVGNNNHASNLIVFPHLTIDLDAYRVTAKNKEINLTPKEYELLVFLSQFPDKVFKREDLLKEVWEYEFFGDLRTVDTHVKRLREKLTNVSIEAAQMKAAGRPLGYNIEVGGD